MYVFIYLLSLPKASLKERSKVLKDRIKDATDNLRRDASAVPYRKQDVRDDTFYGYFEIKALSLNSISLIPFLFVDRCYVFHWWWWRTSTSNNEQGAGARHRGRPWQFRDAPHDQSQSEINT